MINSSDAFKEAVKGAARKILIRAVVKIVDPDIVYSTPSGSAQAAYSNPEQLHDHVFDGGDNYQTLEINRTLLDGSFQLIPDELTVSRQVGFISDAISDDNGVFQTPQIVTQAFSNVGVLQSLSIRFPGTLIDGTAKDFSVTVMSQNTEAASFEITNNAQDVVRIDNFIAENPTAITISVSKWSLPFRRVRVLEIFPGIYEEWTNRDIAALTIRQQANFTSLALPYGRCTLMVDNSDRRFEPENKDGIFRSIEDRQGIDIMLGVKLSDGSVEYKGAGRYFQYSGGWKTGNNDMTIQWDMVDIIGLLTDRQYIPPDVLPTTLVGWVSTIVSQLGSSFDGFYIVDDRISDLNLTISNADEIAGIKCGELLRHVCMAAGAWAHADSMTGKLAVTMLMNEGGSIDLDNSEAYPTILANADIAALVFTLSDGTRYVAPGDTPSSNNTPAVSNPFIQTTVQADSIAERIKQFYGGNVFEAIWRGDPSAELGDVNSIEIGGGRVSRGRIQSQTFQFAGGVLRGCQTSLIEVKE